MSPPSDIWTPEQRKRLLAGVPEPSWGRTLGRCAGALVLILLVVILAALAVGAWRWAIR